MAGRMVDLIDVDGSSDISFQEFRRFAVLLPQSQVIHQTSWSVLPGIVLCRMNPCGSLSDLQWHCCFYALSER